MDQTRVRLNDDEAEEVDDDISSAIMEDDKEKFISLIHTPGLENSNSMYNSVRQLLLHICQSDSVNCATAMLDGELAPVIPRLDVWEYYLLHYAARSCVPGVMELFLSRGAPTDVIVDNSLDGERPKTYDGLLPLEIALDVARWYLERVFVSPSTFQLIVSLCLPRMKRPLKAIKLLAWYSKNVEKIAYYYAMEGKLAEFAVLLAVAREKVVVPITFSEQDGDGWNGSMTLHQWLKNEFVSLEIEEYKVLGSVAERNLAWIDRKKRLLKSIALLLEVFGTAGDAIEEYIQLEQHDEDEVEKGVELRLLEAGCRLKDGNFDFNISNWMNFGDSVRSRPFSRMTWDFSSRTGEILGINHSKRLSCISKFNFGLHYSTSSRVQVKNQTKTMEQGLPKYFSREKLAHISMLIKKGIRSA